MELIYFSRSRALLVMYTMSFPMVTCEDVLQQIGCDLRKKKNDNTPRYLLSSISLISLSPGAFAVSTLHRELLIHKNRNKRRNAAALARNTAYTALITALLDSYQQRELQQFASSHGSSSPVRLPTVINQCAIVSLPPPKVTRVSRGS